MTPSTPHLRRLRARIVALVIAITILPAFILTTLLVGSGDARADERAGDDPTGTELAITRITTAAGLTLPIVPAPNAAPTERPARAACPAPGAEFVDSWGSARSGGRRHKASI